MAARDKALANKDIAEFQRLTLVIAEMPMADGSKPSAADRKAWKRYATK